MKSYTLNFMFLLFSLVNCDIYMHNPRGSNNRLDENGRERRNANRLFDSQNNNRGGYNVGSLYYYAGSKLPIEWTNQHSCGSDNNKCEIILQYMCSSALRDGATTTTIPDNLMNCEDYNCNMDTEYGMHEDYDYYLKCKMRERNMNLFIADQKLGGSGGRGKRGIDRNRNKAKNTRQNPNGNRRGYECPEERDYYPYWHPTPWIDIAVLTNDPERCDYYRENSENVKGRHECVIPREVLIHNQDILIPNNKQDCEEFKYPEDDEDATRGVWTEIPAHNRPAPDCREAEFSRDNHLGNGIGGYPLLYNWTVPNHIHEHCALRIRYNISTEDYDGWNTDESTDIDLSKKFGFDDLEEANDRGYEFENNPGVQIFPGLPNLRFQLAINTAQYGRTFQDRSHRFAIREQPSDLEGGEILNLNVRGKRGNIVQVYPAVEYDFVPNTMHLPIDSYIHIQWTGANNNPHNNDGQGRAGTDRSNIVLQRLEAYPEGTRLAYQTNDKYGHWGRSYPEIAKNTTFLGLPQSDIHSLALLSPGHFGGDLSELDDAGTYFDLGLRKVTTPGIYHYFCTRNNNFSNRSQKGRLICNNVQKVHAPIGTNGGNMTAPGGAAKVTVKPGDFEQLHKMSLEIWPTEDAEYHMKILGRESPVGDRYGSPFIILHPQEELTPPEKSFSMSIRLEKGAADNIEIYRTSMTFATWTSIDSEVSGSDAVFLAKEGGVYVAVKKNSVPIIVGAIIGSLVFVIVIVAATVFYCRKNPQICNSITRSFGSKV